MGKGSTVQGLLVLCLIIWCYMDMEILAAPYKVESEYDICNPKMPIPGIIPPIVYLANSSEKTELYINWKESWHKQCVIDFKTCPKCQLGIQVKDPPWRGCGTWVQPARYYDGKCNARCPYFYFMDEDYKNQSTRIVQSTGDATDSYYSESSKVRIVACRNFSTGFDDLTMTRFLIVARKKLTEISQSFVDDNGRVISSPFFPSPCIQNGETYTYIFKSRYPRGHITVTFNDWLVSPLSEFKFSDANVKGIITGRHSRPYIISEGPYMTMTFFTGNFRHPGTYYDYPGFNADVRFWRDKGSTPLIDTGCGGIIKDRGGFIQTKSLSDREIYRDCIWVVKKPSQFAGVHLLRAELNRNLDPFTRLSLEIRLGLTSVGLLASKMVASTNGEHILDHHLTSVNGFYIRLRGRVSPKTLVISYAAYKYDCEYRNSRDMFQCKNQRCIDQDLRCDGHDHCGDNSDESPATCTTHYDANESHNTHVGIIIPLVVSFVVIIIFCILILFLRKCRRLQRSNTPRRAPRPRRQNVQMCVTVTSGEHPPSYSEVVRTTPVGNVSMAFTWSQGDQQVSQPPSYEEAIEAENFDLSSSARQRGQGFDSDNCSYNTESNFGPSGISVTNATIVASLDPSAYDSSSSSSDYRGDDNVRSCPSESSTDDDSQFAPAFVLVNPHSGHSAPTVSFVPERQSERTSGNLDHGSDRQRIGYRDGRHTEDRRENRLTREGRNRRNDSELDSGREDREVDDRVDFDYLRGTQNSGPATNAYGKNIQIGRISSEEGHYGGENRQESNESKRPRTRRNGDRLYRETVSRYGNEERGVDSAQSNRYQQLNSGPREETSGAREVGEECSNQTALIRDNTSMPCEESEESQSLPLEGGGVTATFV